MIKVKDGYAKLIGTTTTGSASHLLLSNGGVKAVSDFVDSSALDEYLPLTGGTLSGYTRIALLAEPYTLSKSKYSDYIPSGTIFHLIATENNVSSAALINIDTTHTNGDTNSLYFGGVNSGLSNGASNFVIGRRTGTSTWVESLRIDANGNVGIGTDNPTGKLEVRGNIIINEASYDLLSLVRNTTNVEAGIGIRFANSNGNVSYLHALPKDGYLYRGTSADNYLILDTGNYTSHTVESKAWTAVTTKNTWSRIMTIGANSNVILTICFSQNSQASAHGYFISTGWNCARIMQTMMGGYSNNSTPQVRVTKTDETTFHVEVYNTYGYNGATSISFGCRAILAYGSMSIISTYTAGGGTVASSLTSSNTVAMNFKAEAASTADSATSSDYLRSTGWGNGTLTWRQDSASFYGTNLTYGWGSYLINNHGNGETYYNQVMCFPFFHDNPYYQRMENGSAKGWRAFALMETGNPGNLYAAHFYENSDIRYKEIIEDIEISKEQLAKLPLFNYKWTEGEDTTTVNAGSSAQEVQKILPQLVSNIKERLTLDYGVLGTIAGITACRELTEHEKEINKLKEQIKFLKDELNNLKNNKLWQS